MKVDNILKITAGYLNKESLIEIFGTEIDIAKNQEAQELLDILNLILKRLASEYALCINTERIWFNDEDKFNLSLLKRKFFAVRSLKNNFGFNAKVFESDGYLIAKSGDYLLTYIFLPDDVEIGQEIKCFPSYLLEQTVALGVASEYFLRYGFFSEYEVYEFKFQENLSKLTRRFNEIKVKGRKWE